MMQELLRPSEPSSEIDRYDEFCEIATKKLGPELAERWIEKIWHSKVEAEEDSRISQEQAFEELYSIAARRKAAHDSHIRIDHQESYSEYNQTQQAITAETIFLSQSMPEKFLGNGAVAEVYKLVEGNGLCVKIIMNTERYNEGNNVWKEAEFLKELKHFSVAGVRTPHLKNTISTIDLTAIVMEELNAANFSRVLEGKDELPESFNFESYFDDLHNYLVELHKRGIYHCDFYLRNIMIDRLTGKPYVIDFGKAVFRRDKIGEKFDVEEDIMISKDFAGLQQSKARVREWLKTRG